MSRGRNIGSPVARGYQILLWATRKKTPCSPLIYQTLWLYGRKNQQSAVRICSNHLLPSSASLPNWHTLQIAALDALSIMFDKYRHCNCRLVSFWWLFQLKPFYLQNMALSEACLANVMLLLYAPTYTCQHFTCQCQMCQPS